MADPATTTNPTTIKWLEELYGTADAGWVTLFSLNRNTGEQLTDWAEVDNLEALADKAALRAPTTCVWFGPATRIERIGGGRRGRSDECLALPGFWLDVDIAGPGHYSGNRLARDRAHARQLVDAFPLAPTVIVDTGGGIQAWWLFPELVDLDDRLLELLAAFGATWVRLAHEADMDLDNVFDVARIMRLPGTTNRKEGLARPVEVAEADWGLRYGLDDIESYLDDAPGPKAHATGPARVTYIGPERPGDAFNTRHTGGDVLHRNGFTLGHTNRNGEEHWVRPGKEKREGTSATVYPDDGHTTIWSDTCVTMWPSLQVRRPYDPFGLFVAIEYAGDFSRARADLRDHGYGAEQVDFQEVSSLPAPPERPDAADTTPADVDWRPHDLGDILAGDHQPPQPTILAPPNGMAMFYPGRVNSVFGESGVGKTWVELAAIVDVIVGGGRAMLIDLEDTPYGIVSRLKLLGLTDHQIATQFLYVSPHTSWGPVAQATIAAVLDERQVDLMCIDSTGEAMAAGGVKGNDDDDVARWFVNFPKFIARRGPAVIIVDHVPKDPNAPAGYAIGSQRKVAAVDGAAYRVESVKVPSKVDDGLLKIITAKDRHGNHTKGKVAAMVSITHQLDGAVTINLSNPEATPVDAQGNFRPTHLMEKVSELLEATPGLSGRVIESRVNGRAKNVREALAQLITEGYVELDPSARKGSFAYVSVRPFSSDVDEVTDGVSLSSGGDGTMRDDPQQIISRGFKPSDSDPSRLKGVVPHRPASSVNMRDEGRPLVPPPKGTRDVPGTPDAPPASQASDEGREEPSALSTPSTPSPPPTDPDDPLADFLPSYRSDLKEDF